MAYREKTVVVSGGFDDIRSGQVRLLEEAGRLGQLQVLLWDDAIFNAVTGKTPNFPLAERQYFLEAVRYVRGVHVIHESFDVDGLPMASGVYPDIWVVPKEQDNKAKRSFCARKGYAYRVLHEDDLAGFPDERTESVSAEPGPKKVIVTGCYDWFHTGHIRFFEEASAFGDLYVAVGHDANVRELKGDGHPMLPQEERRYMVQSIRYVKEAMISTGRSWMDAEPEIERIRPELYIVNEDGDKPIKREFCERRGIKYVVLKRIPKAGLPSRDSTTLRGY